MPNPIPGFPWFTRGALVSRSQQIFATLTRHGLSLLLNRLDESIPVHRDPRKSDENTRRNQAVRLRRALVELGPTFIKMGQMLSSRADLLPADFIEELIKLQDDVPPTPFPATRKEIEHELGHPIEEIFAEFNPIPLASASIGQVYAAQLTTGHPVVVKVIRPGVIKSIEQDLEILMDMAAWGANNTSLGRRYDLVALVDEFTYTLRNELDYIREGRNADAFRKNFYDDLKIKIPRVYWEYTTHSVITLERLTGIKINQIEALDAAHINRRVVAENLMHFALTQIFDHGLYHADPHPGNFFVQPNGALAVMDFGMVGRLNQHTKKTLLGIAIALQRQDSEILVDELLTAGVAGSLPNRKLLVRDIDRALEEFSRNPLAELSATRMVREIMSLALKHNLQLPGELVAMVRAITISEGTGTLLYPQFRLDQFAAPYVSHFWEAERSPQKIAPRVAQAALDSMELTVDLPRRISRLLGQLERGQIEMRVNMEPLNETIRQLQKMTNRLSLAVILAGSIVGFSMLIAVYRPAFWAVIGDYIVGFGLISSILFGMWVMVSIIRSGRT